MSQSSFFCLFIYINI